MFVIRTTDGEEIKGESENLMINHETGVLTVRTVDGFEEITTHYSPAGWRSVTHRKKDIGAQTSRLSSVR
ncbi:hypothetical protein [Mycobacterium asiaticum]|uniref:Uncharacterized protein n=1 Tax=Mycobacterium asiaticum TaxID=1790 RepID=A0A1A3NGC6_MYCAS|nr:hypothetical protein [Mycobacterium asiaticum]OBK19452.1 hypothetical protein A5636_18895 [Mycobacterium asiaticum]